MRFIGRLVERHAVIGQRKSSLAVCAEKLCDSTQMHVGGHDCRIYLDTGGWWALRYDYSWYLHFTFPWFLA